MEGLICFMQFLVSASCVWSFLSLQNLVSWRRCIFTSASKYWIPLISCNWLVCWNIGISYSLLCHVELYFWILLALDMGSGRAVHNPFFCSKFTLSLLYITIESEDEGLTLDDCCLFHRCFCRHFYQIFLWNRSRACLPPFGTSNTWHWNYLVWIHVYEGKECNLHGQPVLFFSSIFLHL